MIINSSVHIQIQIQNTYANRQTLFFGYERFISFWLLFFDTRRETQYLLCWPSYADPTPNVRYISWCLRFLSVEIRKTQLHLQWSKSIFQLFGRELNYLPAWSNVNFHWLFFQNPQILRTISSGNDVINTPAPFSVWSFYDNGDCHILCARSLPNDCAPELRAE